MKMPILENCPRESRFGRVNMFPNAVYHRLSMQKENQRGVQGESSTGYIKERRWYPK
jgi:hypothetical protein